MIITRIPEYDETLGIALPDPADAIGKNFPDFMIIGPWRTGTTWLSEALRQVPDIFITTPKEPLYFSELQARHPKAPKELLWYLNLFETEENAHQPLLRGEASAAYAATLSPAVIRFIAGINPQIKIILGIRHPVDRAWSHAKMNINDSVEGFKVLTPAERLKEALSRDFVINAGYFHRHIGRWKSVIPEAQIYLFEYARLQTDAAGVLGDVCAFLGTALSPDEAGRITDTVGRVADTARWEIPAKYRRKLDRRYRREITLLSKQYQISFPAGDHDAGTRPLILVPNDTLEYSETFIANHLRGTGGTALSIQEFLPLGRRPDSSLAGWLTTWFPIRNNRNRLSARLRQHQGPVLIEYGTTAAHVLPVLRAARQKCVIHFHGYDVFQRALVADNAEAYRELFQLAYALVVVSREMGETLIRMGAPPEKVHHIVCGVSPEMFTAASPGNNPPVFFSCGRFVEKKAPDLTIRAFYLALQKHNGIKLRMAGDGPLLRKCKELTESLGIEQHVVFTGILRPMEVVRELSGCRAFVQHSVVAANGDSEGTPVGILEAGCSGVPVIATRHAGISDVVIEGTTGLLCDEQDVDAMSEAIIELAARPELAATLGAQARAHITAHYTLDITIEKLKAILFQSVAE